MFIVHRSLAAVLPWSAPMPLLSADEDQETVDQVLAGDLQKFEVLMRRHNQRLYRAARAILTNDADAEDAVQQGYVNAYRKLRQFAGRSQFATWLTRIVVHEALSRRRRLRDRSIKGSDACVHDVPSDEHDPERHAYVSQLGALLRSAVEALPESYRSVFVLREIDGLTTSETAQRLALTEAATKARLHRAKGLLRRCLWEERTGRL